MTNVNDHLRIFVAEIGKLQIGISNGDASAAEKLERFQGGRLGWVEEAPAFKSISKVSGTGTAEFIVDCAVLIGLVTAMQNSIASTFHADWAEPTLGQARAHAHVDLWGHTQSGMALLSDLLTSCNEMKSSQIEARLEVLIEVIRQSLAETSQALMMKGEGAAVTPVLAWALAKFEKPVFKQLSGSILKELHNL